MSPETEVLIEPAAEPDLTPEPEPEPPTSRKPRRGRKPKSEVEVPVPAETLADVSRRGNTTGWSEADIDALQLLLASLLILITSRVASVAAEPELRATEQEINAVSEPLARIILRHIKIAKGKRGDIADLLAIAAAIVAYTIRVFDVMDRKRKPQARVLAPEAASSNGTEPAVGWTLPS